MQYNRYFSPIKYHSYDKIDHTRVDDAERNKAFGL